MRSRLFTKRKSLCFCVSRSSCGHSLQASSVRMHLLRLAHRAGIEKCFHPYSLCHTCAAELAMEHIPVHVMRKQLGHASLHTTTVYLEFIAPVELEVHYAPAELEPLTALPHPRYRRQVGVGGVIAGAINGCAGFCTQHGSRGDPRWRAGRARRAISSPEESPTTDRDASGYSPQIYDQLAAVYRRSGHDDDARRVLIAKQRRRFAQRNLAWRVEGYVLDGLVASKLERIIQVASTEA